MMLYEMLQSFGRGFSLARCLDTFMVFLNRRDYAKVDGMTFILFLLRSFVIVTFAFSKL